jgi:hypothetical protein
MLQYYCGHRLICPQSTKEMETLTSHHSELRCVYLRVPWESSEQTEIARFLEKRCASKHSFGNRIGCGPVWVFVLN